MKSNIAGHRGLAGSAHLRRLTACVAPEPGNGERHTRIVTRAQAELDLTDQRAVAAFLEYERPDCVVLAAARVGGIHATNTYAAEFVQANLAIQTNVIREASRAGVQRLLFLGSSCICPRDCQQPT